ncbi:MAG: HPr(Ser) kinase/phosphatase, partial [Fibrobacterota bacterium]
MSGSNDFSLVSQKQSITVKELFEKNAAEFKTRLLSGKRFTDRPVQTHEIHFPGLALTGFLYHFHFNKIQMIADMEWHYLNSLSPRERRTCVKKLLDHPIPAIIVTSSRTPHPELLEGARGSGVPVFGTPLTSPESARRISDFLEDYFAPKMTMHASLVDVYGIGLLYTGKSGIGKSECALDLIERGHRLVADDIITLTQRNGTLVGQGSPLLGHHMEIRGIGIINIQSLFGIRAIRLDKKVEVVVELVTWNPKDNYDRTGLNETVIDIMGVRVDKVTIPIFPGKNITVISEVI